MANCGREDGEDEGASDGEDDRARQGRGGGIDDFQRGGEEPTFQRGALLRRVGVAHGSGGAQGAGGADRQAGGRLEPGRDGCCHGRVDSTFDTISR